ncbi:MAG TPA: hypothetical protein VGK61_07960 [Planctomycetota bacterium]
MTDYLIAMCDSCGHHVRVSLEHGGRRAKCPKCAAIIDIPRTESGILRLRTDTELTREARAKAGRGDPDSDPSVPAAGRASSARSSGGRHTTVHRRVVHPHRKGRRILLIVSLVATLGIMIAIGAILFKRAPGTAEAPVPPPPTVPKTPPPPPAEKPDPYATERGEIQSRLARYIKAFNTNDIENKISDFYACDLAALNKAFGGLGMDIKLEYQDWSVASIEFASKEEARVKLKCLRIFTNNDKKTTDRDEVERALTWSLKDGKWKISSHPEP